MKHILVLCTGNSCRSQMAEGWLRLFVKGAAVVTSAGIEAHGVNPRAIAVMREAGVDISGHTSKTVDSLSPGSFDYVITVCDNARERCPYFPAATKTIHHDFADPAKAAGSDEEVLNVFRSVRDQIKLFCQEFVNQHLR